ncbi:MAG: sigma-54-dependent Fis family transcriptional regulator [Gammaproteobacteria bacterium]|nr:MAG: sigma-54-dependent Fis family transcriptional regulator [Gammaproteobacteria bacterium]
MGIDRVLIVDDEPDIRELLSITLSRMGLDCATASDLAEAHRLLAQEEFDLCLTDMRLPDGDGLELVGHIQRHCPRLPVAVITAHGNMESAISALKLGAFDFLSKPVELETLRTLVSTALRLRGEERSTSTTLIGGSAPIEELRRKIAKLARSQAPVYLSGESGTGKELAARLIHEMGPRAEGPFVPVNCGAIPAELMESEFFGHVKGSFTGATADKAGLFQAAHGGTLFLDEVAELPLPMQVKLLRAIQEKAVRPVGAQREEPVDVRILSATHKDLGALVEAGQFRQDLYYRINVIELRIPPLRERPGDIPLLAGHILERLCPEEASRPRIEPAALSLLESYSFPGNVRELENILERALALCEGGVIRQEDLGLPEEEDEGPGSGTRGDLDDYIQDVERRRILQALEETRWNRTAAARRLGLSLRSLRYRIQKLGLEERS